MYPETFRGFFVKDKENWSTFEEQDITPKKLDDYDIDVKIHYCGVCGSDLHTIQSGWGEALYPICVGKPYRRSETNKLIGLRTRSGRRSNTSRLQSDVN